MKRSLKHPQIQVHSEIKKRSNENVTGEEKPEAAESHSNNDDSTNDERPVDGGEKGKDTGPPKPAGFWDKIMNKVRLQVFGLWARTGQ